LLIGQEHIYFGKPCRGVTGSVPGTGPPLPADPLME